MLFFRNVFHVAGKDMAHRNYHIYIYIFGAHVITLRIAILLSNRLVKKLINYVQITWFIFTTCYNFHNIIIILSNIQLFKLGKFFLTDRIP